ncbi:MAG: PEP-CTERM sorting domain-containing protein [Pelomonas sp.]|nr:PEP-CTERM sorting domain-containing protein [Roseateles sp.]
MLRSAPLACARRWHPIALACLAAAPLSAQAANFSITSPSTTAQSLGASQTGSVAAGASLAVSGSTVAVTVTGNNASLSNLGTITQTGSGRVIRDNTGVTSLVVTNGSTTNATALMQAADADVIQMNKSPASVVLHNYGQMISLNASAAGNQVVDFNAIASGSNVVNNYAGALMKSYEADAVRPGVNGVVNNWGTILSITTTGSSSDGIDGQANSGIQIVNAGLVQGGRHGITGGQDTAALPYTMSITNQAGGVIQGDNGSGLNLDGFNGLQVVTVHNAGTIVGRGVTGDGDGVDVDGVVMLTNTATGVIRSANSFSAVASGLAYSEGISVGGGSITNAGLIEGLVAAGNTNAVGRGISLVGNDIAGGRREALYANAIVVNQAGGVIRGQSDAAIYAGGLNGSGRTVSIHNDAGATLLGGAGSAAIVVSNDYATTIVNRGLIDGSASGRAIQLGSGQNSVTIAGGQAQVLGRMDGGSGGANSLRIDPGAGQGFAYASSLSNFAVVQIASGRVVLSGENHYTGKTVVASGAALELAGAQRLDPVGALELAGGQLVLGGDQSLATLVLSASSTIALGSSTLSFGALGDVAAGAALAVSGSGGYALRFSGNQLGDASFQSLLAGLTINGEHATASFDGVYTGISAVPEPASTLMLALGLAVLAFRRRAALRCAAEGRRRLRPAGRWCLMSSGLQAGWPSACVGQAAGLSSVAAQSFPPSSSASRSCASAGDSPNQMRSTSVKNSSSPTGSPWGWPWM